MRKPAAKIITSSCDLPEFESRSFFHSKSLFLLYEQTPRQKPYMVVLETDDGEIVGHLLAVVRYRLSLFPPYIYSHCRIYGEGEYIKCDMSANDLFGIALRALTCKLHNRVLYMELSNLSTKMFGYKLLRENQYFPIQWMGIHNSLHSKDPKERLSEKMLKRIDNAYHKGVETIDAESEEDIYEFFRLLKEHNRFKYRRYIPDIIFFKELQKSGNGRLFVTKYKNRIIGCCACAFSEGNAFLWYSAFRRKSFIMLHPDTVTIWHAIMYAHKNGYAHIEFMDVGLPFRKNPFREFILRFGGKPVSTYRWFRFSFKWLNSIFSWLYRD